MSATKARIPLAHAEEVADDVITYLRPYCTRIAVAGSIRRRKAAVSDIEVVAIPRTESVPADLFGEHTVERDLLHRHVTDLRDQAVFSERLDINGRPRFGPKTKLLRYQEVSVDLFTATPDNWGWIYLLRTGPGEFNTRVVTQWHAGGKVMPFGMRSHDGYLWRGDTRLSTPEEIDAFTALELAWIKPEDRG